MAPSIWRSPPPEMLPSNCRSEDRVERPRWETGEGAGRAPEAAGVAAGAPGIGRSGSGGMADPVSERGCGAGDLVLLNKLVSGSQEAGGVLRAAVHPHLIVQVN